MSNFLVFQTLFFIKKTMLKIVSLNMFYFLFLLLLFSLYIQTEIICEKKNTYKHISYVIIYIYI